MTISAVVPRKQGRKGIRIRQAMGWVTITVRNITFECTCKRGRQLLVPICTDHLDRIVQHLLPRSGEESRLTPHDFKHLLKEGADQRLAWRISRSIRRAAPSQGLRSETAIGHWIVFYTDADGKDCESYIGLGVPRSSLQGEPLTAEEQMYAAQAVLVKAKREWNRLDCSGEEKCKV
jgi:hypothetical protein